MVSFVHNCKTYTVAHASDLARCPPQGSRFVEILTDGQALSKQEQILVRIDYLIQALYALLGNINDEDYILQNCTQRIDSKLYASSSDGQLIEGKGSFETDENKAIIELR